jgi:6-phosphogluconolactonase (cycloisomerase 2 family)
VVDLLVGCYTGTLGSGEGIGRVTASGIEPLLAAESPSFVAVHPRLPIAYAVCERELGELVTFGLDGVELDRRPSYGSHPCHVAVSEDGRWAAVANYFDGSATVLALGPTGLPSLHRRLDHEGSGLDLSRQDGPHAHQAVFAGDLLLVVDLGSDTIHRYRLLDDEWQEAEGGPAHVRAGSGPRHLVALGTRRWVVGELDATVTAYDEDASGHWHELGACSTSSYVGGPAYPSHIAYQDGHLYVANRTPSTIAVLRLGDGTPRLLGEVATGGDWPRHFALLDDAVVVANERSHELTWLPLTGGPVPGPVSRRQPSRSATCVVQL